jgi:hypothetical protein
MLTIRQVQDATGVSYAVVYRHVRKNVIRFSKSKNGEIFIDMRDVVKIEKRVRRPSAPKTRASVWLTVDPARLEAWKVTAGSMTMRKWLGTLADAASGFSEPVVEPEPVVPSVAPETV